MSRCMIRPHPLVRARFWGFWMGSPPGSGGVRRWGRTGLRPLVHPVLVALALLPVEVVAQAPVVRDSAGVRIVENDSAALDGRTPWRNGEEPLLSIGVADGEPAYLFTAVNGATVLPDGAIAVADGAGHDVRLFDSVGAHVRTIGRQGQGPGEFSGRVGIVTYIEGDLLGVVSGARMLSVFRPTGEFVGSSHLRPEELHGQSGWQWPHGGVLRTGSPVVWTGESPWQRPISGAWRRPERLDLLDSSGEHVRKIADFPGIETSVDQLEGGGTHNRECHCTEARMSPRSATASPSQ